MRLSILFLLLVTVVTVDAQETPPTVTAEEPQYPLAVAIDGDSVFVVDLDLPGVWKVDGAGRQLFVHGSKLFRQPLNRPRCIAIHPRGGILVGDSATREVYHIESAGAQPKPLANAKIGIAMAIAVSPDGSSIFVGCAERRAVLKMPIDGGEPKSVAQVNARGLAFDSEGRLWAVTPDDSAIHRIDVSNETSEVIVKGRPYQYPNGIVWAGERGFVTDGYGKSIWSFTSDGKTEPWHAGTPLVGPVGIAAGPGVLWIADPKQKQVYQFEIETKSPSPQL